MARTAAIRGSAEAQFLLGAWYMEGSVFAQNRQEGFRWLKKSADQGFADAQMELSRAYELGLGTIKNPLESYFWMQLASVRFPDAPHQPDAKAASDRLAAKLNVAQIAVTRIRVRDWKPASGMLLAKSP
jgi:TPR repeat protein